MKVAGCGKGTVLPLWLRLWFGDVSCRKSFWLQEAAARRDPLVVPNPHFGMLLFAISWLVARNFMDFVFLISQFYSPSVALYDQSENENVRYTSVLDTFAGELRGTKRPTRFAWSR